MALPSKMADAISNVGRQVKTSFDLAVHENQFKYLKQNLIHLSTFREYFTFIIIFVILIGNLKVYYPICLPDLIYN